VRRSREEAEARPASATLLNPLVALLVHPDTKAAAAFADVFEDVACDWRLVRVPDGGAAARHIMNKGLPDLLVTATELPQVSGPDLVEWMRSFRSAHNVPVLVFGEPVQDVTREQFLRNEVKHFLAEDSPRQVLATRLSALVGAVEKVRYPAFA